MGAEEQNDGFRHIGCLVGLAFFVLFWTAVILGTIWLAKAIARQGDEPHHTRTASPIEVARLRYARGDIGKEQFEQIKKDLS